MKKICTICVLFLCFYSFSQIKVIEVVPVENLGRVNNFHIQKVGTEYNIYFMSVKAEDDEQPASMKKFSFKNVNNDYATLYNIIIDGFTSKVLKDTKLELPNNYVWLHYEKETNKVTFRFMLFNKDSVPTGISEPLTKEEVMKLFQKA